MKDPNSCTALAWDNFDIDILPGADSVYHTFSICYQNESQTSKEVFKRDVTVRKRKIKDIEKILWYKQAQEVKSGRKKPTMSHFQFANVSSNVMEVNKTVLFFFFFKLIYIKNNI